MESIAFGAVTPDAGARELNRLFLAAVSSLGGETVQTDRLLEFVGLWSELEQDVPGKDEYRTQVITLARGFLSQ
jgi:hypothetical protein